MPFMMRENIVAFLEAAKSYGLKDTDSFVTQDLFEGDNQMAVLNAIQGLSGIATSKGFDGPTVGVKKNLNTDATKKFEVSATGSSIAPKLSMGSYGVLDDTPNRSIARQIIKTTDKASSVPSRLNDFDPKLESQKSLDKIIRVPAQDSTTVSKDDTVSGDEESAAC